MSGVFYDSGLVPRGDELAEIRANEQAIRAAERDRRINASLKFVVPWAVAGFLACTNAGTLGLMYTWPVGRDTVHVVVEHADGTFEPSVPRENLPPERKQILFEWTVSHYIMARENYNWTGEKNGARVVMAMSEPNEAKRYGGMIHDVRNPENPEAKYGPSGVAIVEAVNVLPSKKDQPNFVEAMFLLRIQIPNQPVKRVRKYARMSFVEAGDRIDMGVQKMYDPAGIAFLDYASGDLDSGS